ncbi:Type I phosphodiesterase / nucleotide pyrophosphatase [Caldanaerovirga acetigignens]|uniref:Type I phosphodiesterase / nucleotide pyrophosphatase n=1 Tax=Caldanaerovirga acetigignens TaxID=447595 RepID=A0A1M7KKK4_9FIRM|nr:alkaline phosphatase family protein [Caldanaerovirga acetigignens]SHM65928.1 Type I phosphodiesterase / nucleotide pyrophosphatase [Caldanaerovirga acetigignens]
MIKKINKTIMILIDGLSFKTAFNEMGFLNHLVEKGIGALYKVETELPPLSRPLYETIFTGVVPCCSGITTNKSIRLSSNESIFHLARDKGLKTSASAYYFLSELYNKAPFDPICDREQMNEKNPIQYGKFYFEDSYPDSHVFVDGEILRKNYDPDFLLIHTMGMDYVGHIYGSNSKEYKAQAGIVDGLLAWFLTAWIDQGYHIIVTSDHGMRNDGLHQGTGEEERIIPLFCISNLFKPGYNDITIPQTAIAPMICEILGVNTSSKMISFNIKVFRNN